MEEFPKLRPLEAVPAEAGGRRVYVLRDASRITNEAITVSEDILFVMHLLDGYHSPLDIRTEYMRRFGSFLFESQLDELLHKLDECFLLEGENFDSHVMAMEREFLELESRPASFAGTAYPADGGELCRMIDGFFAGSDGPGALATGPGVGPAPRGLVLPHIDIRAGGSCLAWGYKEIAERSIPQIFVILGTGHSGPENNFALTEKDFVTPLGRARTDRDFASALRGNCDFDLMAGEFAHKSEHSVEFQVLFLQYVLKKLGMESGPTIVPLLCSFGFRDVAPGGDPAFSRIQEFASALRRTTKESGLQACTIASADLAHLGPRYGDPRGIAAAQLPMAKARDLEMLAPVERGDAEGFASWIRGEEDGRRVCGFGPIYTLLKSMGPSKGAVIKHGCAPVDQNGSVVSFVSMVFE